MEIYSLILSSVDTTCHSDVLTKDGMFGFCVMSSSALIAFAALTDIEYSSNYAHIKRYTLKYRIL